MPPVLRGGALLVPAVVAALLVPSVAASAPAPGLATLDRLAVEVVVAPAHPDVDAGGLARRVEAAMGAAGAPRVEAGSEDRLRVDVSVHRVTATELRGYYLPFSGAYGLGSVRLSVHRPVMLPGVAGALGAVVWQSERLARAPWRRSGSEVAALVDALVARFLEEYRRARGLRAGGASTGRLAGHSERRCSGTPEMR